MKGKRSRVLGSCNWTRRDKDGGRKGEECVGLVNTKVCQGYVEIPRIGKLLLLIYRRLCIHS